MIKMLSFIRFLNVTLNSVALNMGQSFRIARSTIIGLALVAILLGTGCATVPDDPEERQEYKTLNDPLEPTNRVIFSFNEQLDRFIFRPLSMAYLQVPKYGRDRIHNAIVNVRAPVILGNSLLQGDMQAVGSIVSRFILNSSIGLGGMYDVATTFGIEQTDNDFGRTLARYGANEGPYLVLPVLGPSSVRSLFGRAGDTLLDPLLYVYNGQNMDPEAGMIQGGITGIDIRSRLFGVIEDVRENSIDHYATMRSYYRQERRRATGTKDDDDFDSEGYDVLGPTVELDIEQENEPRDNQHAIAHADDGTRKNHPSDHPSRETASVHSAHYASSPSDDIFLRVGNNENRAIPMTSSPGVATMKIEQQ